ncbi:copper amine oxidase N-terminal domain-containing protein [Cohnella thailandensis]|uniref:Copper amine oxidase N-terminal domain-containing protein n=1 Tax=Cohnella thailandensis TaxID=557557 RepID=A0A841T3L3_9BACL|nr:copper amine oxidase N-terminal domain-containing protein [Cohnella thailandensis]
MIYLIRKSHPITRRKRSEEDCSIDSNFNHCSSVGASVQYDAKTKIIQLTKSDKSVVVVVDSKTMKVNNVASTLNVAPVAYKGITYVPVRVFSSGLGISVSYDSSLDRISIEI